MALRQNRFNRPRSLSDDLGDESEIFRYAAAPKLPTPPTRHTGNARGRIGEEDGDIFAAAFEPEAPQRAFAGARRARKLNGWPSVSPRPHRWWCEPAQSAPRQSAHRVGCRCVLCSPTLREEAGSENVPWHQCFPGASQVASQKANPDEMTAQALTLGL
jgi:hypothetical protein